MSADLPASEPQRLSRRVAAERGVSRQQAEWLVVGGWVRVDGAVVEEPQARVRADQAVQIDPQARPEPVAPVTLLWHKPAGVALPDESPLPPDWMQRHLDPDALQTPRGHQRVRVLRAHGRQLHALAPLDAAASGLMVFSQNTGVLRRLADPQAPLEHEWLVDLPAGAVADRDAVLRELGKPLYAQRSELPPARASWQSDRRLRLVIKGTRPGQLAQLLARAGLQGAAVRRQRMGRVGLGDLAAGQWRYAGPAERF